MAGTFPHLPFQKGVMEAEVPFHHRCTSGQIFGSAKDFCPNLPKNFIVQFSLQIFFHKDHEDLFLV